MIRPLKMLMLSVCLLAGCATLQSGGFEVRKSDTEESFEAVRKSAAFELGCSRTELELVVLGVCSYNDRYANKIDVIGCGKKAAYVRSAVGTSVLNSSMNTPG